MNSKIQAARTILACELGADWQEREDRLLEPLGFTSNELLDACFYARECVFIGSSASIITATHASAHVALRVTDSFAVLANGVRLDSIRSAALGGDTHANWGALPLACVLIETLVGATPLTRLMTKLTNGR